MKRAAPMMSGVSFGHPVTPAPHPETQLPLARTESRVRIAPIASVLLFICPSNINHSSLIYAELICTNRRQTQPRASGGCGMWSI